METTNDEVLKAVAELSMLRRYEESRAQAPCGTASSDEKDEKTSTPRLFPATPPPDSSPLSLAPAPPTVLNEGNLSSTRDSPTNPTDSNVDTAVTTQAEQATLQAEQAYPAFLAPDPEEARRRMWEQVVSATNVHVIEKRSKKRTRDKWIGTLLLAVLASVAAIALSIAFTLGHREDPSPSMIPTPAPTSESFGQVVALVEPLSGEALQDPSSPQYQATQWMAEEDTLFEDLSIVDPDRFRQRYVLALFYFATGGPTSWIETSFFLKPNVHECEWRDEGLPNTQSWSGYVGVFNCSTGLWVQGLEINQNNLTGTLVPELGYLSSLAEFTVFQNSISGTLPPSLFELPDLQILNVWDNQLYGKIPTEVGRATSLTFLVVRRNSLTGTIPREMQELSSLIQFSAPFNFLTGTIPETLLQLSNISYIEFAGNALTGTLPPSLWSSLPSLIDFGVLENMLSGTIPNNLDSLHQLHKLILGKNKFTGPFPSSIVSLTNVTSFNVGGNNLTGSLPDDWNNLSMTLEWLQPALNHLTGTLPESIGNLSALEVLELQENEINGTLPVSMGNLTKLEGLVLMGNRLSGTVPSSFAQLTSLRVLTVNRNELIGDLSFLCNGTKMLFPYMTNFYSDCDGEIVCPCCNLCCNNYDTCQDV